MAAEDRPTKLHLIWTIPSGMVMAGLGFIVLDAIAPNANQLDDPASRNGFLFGVAVGTGFLAIGALIAFWPLLPAWCLKASRVVCGVFSVLIGLSMAIVLTYAAVTSGNWSTVMDPKFLGTVFVFVGAGVGMMGFGGTPERTVAQPKEKKSASRPKQRASVVSDSSSPPVVRQKRPKNR